MKFKTFGKATVKGLKEFNRNKYNRELSRTNVNNLKKSMKKSLGGFPAIMVNIITNNVVDGENRKAAFIDLVEAGLLPKSSTFPIQYVEMTPEEENQQIVEMQGGKKWTPNDFIHAEVVRENPYYIKLVEFGKNHELTRDKKGNIIPRYIGPMITGKSCSATIKNGTFTFTDEQFEEAETIHNEMVQILNTLDIPGSGLWIESLAISWHEMRDHHDFNTWMKEMKRTKRSLKTLPHQKTSDWNNLFSVVHTNIDRKVMRELKAEK